MKKQAWLWIALLAAGTLAAISCSSSDPISGSRARVHVMLTDAPLDLSTVSAVNVTIGEFMLYPAGDGNGEEGGIAMSTPGSGFETLNLLDYQNGQVVLVASVEIAEGDYERIRLRVESAELVRDDDGDPNTPETVEPIKVPSGKVDVPVPFSITAGTEMEITLDFDAEASVQVNTTSGNHPYILRPVITPVGMRSL